MRCAIGFLFIFAVSSALETENLSENRYFCLTIKSDVDLVVTEASLDWGKWVPNPPNWQETSSPKGKRIPANGEVLICSSGRQASLTGTTGSVRVAASDGKSIKIWWTSPWAGALDYKTEFNKDEFSVTPRMTATQRFDFTIRKK